MCRLVVAANAWSSVDPTPVQRAEELKHLLRDDTTSLFSYLCLLKGIAARDRSSTFSPSLMMKSSTEFVVNHKEISLPELQACYATALDEYELGVNSLLLGLPFDLRMADIKDDFSNQSAGFRFKVSWSENFNLQVQSQLLAHIATNPALRQQYIESDVGGRIMFKPQAAKEYLDKLAKVCDKFLLVCHLGSGLPARATELSPMRLRNGTSGMRSVFVNGEQIMLLPHYNKTDAITFQSKLIVRFLGMLESMLLLKEIIFIRPFAMALAMQLGRPTDYLDHLFIRDGVALDAKKICRTFKRQFLICSRGVRMDIVSYRQLAAALARLNHIDGSDELGDEETDFIALQMGHSVATSLTEYGRLLGELPGHRSPETLGYMNTSKKWLKLLKPDIDDAAQVAVVAVAPTNVGPAAAQAIVGPTVPALVAAPLPIINAANDLFGNRGFPAHHYPADQVSALPFSTVTVLPMKRSNLSEFILDECRTEEAADILRRLVGSDSAQFSSDQQRVALEAVLSGKQDLLVILPTGGGKSFLFLGYALANPHQSSIVVVPTVSLQADILRKCADLGINCNGEFRHNQLSTLVVVTPEGLMNEAATSLMVELSYRKKLGTIFFDEAHLFVSEGSFRVHFTLLARLTLFTVPIVLTTGTCPSHIEQVLQVGFFGGIRSPLVIRSNTNRKNLQYLVREVHGNVPNAVINEVIVRSDTVSQGEKIIVFSTSFAHVDLIRQRLADSGIACEYYQGNMSDEEKALSFARWREHTTVMVATSAFGIGIDYHSVRHVIFFGAPFSLEEYIQQAGRAGRDNPSDVVAVQILTSFTN